MPVFLGALLFYGLVWRVDFFITDSWTVANTMVAVADGHLHFETIPYGSARSPGTHVVDRRLYGRNYGHVFLSLPLLWGITAVDRVVGLGIVLPALWSLVLSGFAASVGRRLGRQRAGVAVGLALAFVTFVPNAIAAEPLDPKTMPLAALQLSTMIAAALMAVVAFKLGRDLYGSPVGTFAGAAVILATPVGFWATIPKRHGLTALLPLVAVYCFYRSRDGTDAATATRFRALAYVPVGMTAWIHAPEGLALFVVLATVDVFTARSNDPRQLAVVGTVFALSLLPMLVTNAAISGNPFEPPRALPAFEGAKTAVPDEQGLLPATALPANTDTGSGPVSRGAGLATVVENGIIFVQYMTDSLWALGDADRLYHVFVRGRPGLGTHRFGAKPVNLSVLESMPLLGALLAVPATLFAQVARQDTRERIQVVGDVRTCFRTPERATDLLVVSYLGLLVLMYLPRLPLHVTVTVRYLHPLYPLGVYLLVRLPAVRRAVRREWRTLGTAYAVMILVGLPLFVVTVATTTDTPTGALQVNAGLALGAGAVLAYWALVSTLTRGDHSRAGAVALAFAGATTTAFLVLSPLLYFQNSTDFALPIVRLVAESLVLP